MRKHLLPSNPGSIRDLLVPMVVAYQPEDVQSASREVFLTKMLG
jgi:hypothetical protein